MGRSGWADVARVRDIEKLRDHMNTQVGGLRSEVNLKFLNLETKTDENFKRVDARLSAVDARLNAIVTGLWTTGTVFAGAFIGLFTLIVTKF